MFRNVSGTLVGREADGSDIFFDMPDAPFALQVLSPTLGACSVLQVGETRLPHPDLAGCFDFLSLNARASGEHRTPTHRDLYRKRPIRGCVEASNAEGGTISESFNLIVLPEAIVEAAPDGTKDGVNIVDDNTVILQLRAPFKEYIRGGDHSDWQLDMDYLMKQVPGAQSGGWKSPVSTPASSTATNTGSTTNASGGRSLPELVLDPWNDPWIPEELPNMPDYPSQAGNEPVTVFQTNLRPSTGPTATTNAPTKPTWCTSCSSVTLPMPKPTRRSKTPLPQGFGHHAWSHALQRVQRYHHWGYNPTFYFAPDKFYGTKQACNC